MTCMSHVHYWLFFKDSRNVPRGVEEVWGGCALHAPFVGAVEGNAQSGPEMPLHLVTVPASICQMNNKALKCCFCARTQVGNHFVSDWSDAFSPHRLSFLLLQELLISAHPVKSTVSTKHSVRNNPASFLFSLQSPVSLPPSSQPLKGNGNTIGKYDKDSFSVMQIPGGGLDMSEWLFPPVPSSIVVASLPDGQSCPAERQKVLPKERSIQKEQSSAHSQIYRKFNYLPPLLSLKLIYIVAGWKICEIFEIYLTRMGHIQGSIIL